jgi:nucleolar protein 9
MPPIHPSPYISSLFLSPVSSYLFETIVARTPTAAFSALWATYFKGELARLAVHPVGNFVVAKAVERITGEQLVDACEELERVWARMVSEYPFSGYDVLKMLRQ